MVSKLFVYGECDETDQLIIVYEIVKLVRRIGEHAAGDEFEFAQIDYVDGTLTLIRDAQEWRYPLSLQIGQLLTQEPTQ